MKLLAVLLLAVACAGQEPKHVKDKMYDCADGHTIQEAEWQAVYSKDLARVCFDPSHPRTAEPLLVPAVEVPAESHWGLMPSSHLNAVFGCSNDGHPDKPLDDSWSTNEPKCVEGHRTGCADKFCILLHSEDGTSWCLATPKGSVPNQKGEK